MRNLFFVVAVMVAAVWVLSGCMSYKGFVKVDTLHQRILSLEKQSSEKIRLAKNGKMSVKESLEFLEYARAQIMDIKSQLKDTSKSENVGWPGLVGAVLASVFGATGWVRAWRGPTHKNAKFPT